jgi:hypothetical protein
MTEYGRHPQERFEPRRHGRAVRSEGHSARKCSLPRGAIRGIVDAGICLPSPVPRLNRPGMWPPLPLGVIQNVASYRAHASRAGPLRFGGGMDAPPPVGFRFYKVALGWLALWLRRQTGPIASLVRVLRVKWLPPRTEPNFGPGPPVPDVRQRRARNRGGKIVFPLSLNGFSGWVVPAPCGRVR